MLHGSGEAAIVASNHPSAFIDGRNHRLFVAGRHHLVSTFPKSSSTPLGSSKLTKIVPLCVCW